MITELLTAAREAAGLSKADLAERAHPSRTTLSAYEHGRVSPTLDTADRILAAAGYRLTTTPILQWTDVHIGRGRTVAVPNELPDLPVRQALRTVVMPMHLDWSRPGRVVELADRRQRARAYEVVLREGRGSDIESIVDGALLVDLWDDLILPRYVRAPWQPLIDRGRTPRA
jgi:transcriptional regulator with XRE-family HTH domain